MPRRPRLDGPGTWHHVVNRGIAKRPLFEGRGDMRFFLACVAREVRSGRIELHAYCLMATHFHLLVRSPVGRLSEAMRRIQNLHSRRFNRLHRRDGPLIRGRYFSRPVDGERDLRDVVRYIDANPVRAKIVSAPADHEFGSAAHYLGPRARRWLARSFLTDLARRIAGPARSREDAYAEAFGIREERIAELCQLVERRFHARRPRKSEGAGRREAPPHVRHWMNWKSRIADGLGAGAPVCPPAALLRALREDEVARGAWLVQSGVRAWRGRSLAWCGLLRDLCGLTWREIASRCDSDVSGVRRLHGIHQRLLAESRDYRSRCNTVCGTLLSHSDN